MSDEKRFSLIDYDGINLFYKGKWTTLEVSNVEEGRVLIKRLETLTDEEAEQWIEDAKFAKLAHKTFNILNTEALPK